VIWDDVLEELKADPRVSGAKFFSARAAKLGRRVFAFEWRGDLVVKLGPQDAAAAVASGQETGVRYFDPHGGRPMKAWAVFPVPDSGDPIRAWIELAEDAKEFVEGEE
jgi:hypothetical protein